MSDPTVPVSRTTRSTKQDTTAGQQNDFADIVSLERAIPRLYVESARNDLSDSIKMTNGNDTTGKHQPMVLSWSGFRFNLAITEAFMFKRDNGRRTLKCPLCDLKFYTNKSFRRHFHLTHVSRHLWSSSADIVCNMCRQLQKTSRRLDDSERQRAEKGSVETLTHLVSSMNGFDQPPSPDASAPFGMNKRALNKNPLLCGTFDTSPSETSSDQDKNDQVNYTRLKVLHSLVDMMEPRTTDFGPEKSPFVMHAFKCHICEADHGGEYVHFNSISTLGDHLVKCHDEALNIGEFVPWGTAEANNADGGTGAAQSDGAESGADVDDLSSNDSSGQEEYRSERHAPVGLHRTTATYKRYGPLNNNRLIFTGEEQQFLATVGNRNAYNLENHLDGQASDLEYINERLAPYLWKNCTSMTNLDFFVKCFSKFTDEQVRDGQTLQEQADQHQMKCSLQPYAGKIQSNALRYMFSRKPMNQPHDWIPPTQRAVSSIRRPLGNHSIRGRGRGFRMASSRSSNLTQSENKSTAEQSIWPPKPMPAVQIATDEQPVGPTIDTVSSTVSSSSTSNQTTMICTICELDGFRSDNELEEHMHIVHLSSNPAADARKRTTPRGGPPPPAKKRRQRRQ